MGELSAIIGALLGLDADLSATGPAVLAARLLLDVTCAAAVVHGVYCRIAPKREHVFTCYAFNVVTLCLCMLLRRGSAEVGFALTLFGVFGILRYRTEQIRSRDLTYLFVLIGLGIINGVASGSVGVAELLTVNAIIVGMTVVLELGGPGRHVGTAPLLYDRLDLLRPGQEAALAADLSTRTGLPVVRVDTDRIDLLRDAAEITVHFRRSQS